MFNASRSRRAGDVVAGNETREGAAEGRRCVRGLLFTPSWGGATLTAHSFLDDCEDTDRTGVLNMIEMLRWSRCRTARPSAQKRAGDSVENSLRCPERRPHVTKRRNHENVILDPWQRLDAIVGLAL